jgi:hypothetical protein
MALPTELYPRMAAARRVRAKRLADMTAVYNACACTWPLDTRRNGHGHHEQCPAVPIIEAQQAAKKIAREENL